jgi:hypothetical protein
MTATSNTASDSWKPEPMSDLDDLADKIAAARDALIELRTEADSLGYLDTGAEIGRAFDDLDAASAALSLEAMDHE